MKLLNFSAKSLDWTSLDFGPLRALPGTLPIIAWSPEGHTPKVAAGFHCKYFEGEMPVLVYGDGSLSQFMENLWSNQDLATFERARFQRVLEQEVREKWLLDWPLEFQNYCDSRLLSLKSLKPLKYLESWKTEIASLTLSLKPSHGELKEVLDLLCDLNFIGLRPDQVFSKTESLQGFLTHLSSLKNPMAKNRDQESKNKLLEISWPKGVQGNWIRQGDSAKIQILTSVRSSMEWSKIKSELSKIELDPEIWNS